MKNFNISNFLCTFAVSKLFNMKKELSLNTQLTKLREINSLLKLTVSPAIRLDSLYGGNRGFQIQQFIYSLRDLQYRLRGLKIKVSRSTQVRRMSVSEVYDSINSQLVNSSTEFDDIAEEYFSNLQQVQTLLGTVVQYCNIHKSLEDLEEEQNQKVVDRFVEMLDEYNFPALNQSQVELLRDTLIQRLETQSPQALSTNDELF